MGSTPTRSIMKQALKQILKTCPVGGVTGTLKFGLMNYKQASAKTRRQWQRVADRRLK